MRLEIMGDFKLREEQIDSKTKYYYVVSEKFCVKGGLSYQEDKLELKICKREYHRLEEQLREAGGFCRLCVCGDLEIKTRTVCGN